MQAAQCIHAAGESSPGNLPKGTYAIALHARDEANLWQIAAQLKMAGIAHHLIVEADEPYSGQAMAIGIEPCDRKNKALKRITSKLQLIK